VTADGAAALSDAGWRCAVLGSPISHSLSPALHRAAYAELRLTGWTYDRFDVTEDQLADFVAGCNDNWRGLSLTMPLKSAALELGDVDSLARFAGSANTLIFDGLRRRLYNTDIGGLVWAVQQLDAGRPLRVTILGSGATARSAVLSAEQLGARNLTIMARTMSRTEQLEALGAALQLDVQVLPWGADLPAADLLISTVTSTAVDPIAAVIARSAPIVFDVSYQPWPTALARAAQQAGASVINGLDLLVGQALGQIELMTGRTVSADVLYAAGRAALAGRTLT
jgi:shikimate dehydrogenase